MKKHLLAVMIGLVPVVAYLDNNGYLDGSYKARRIPGTEICVPPGHVEPLVAPFPYAAMKEQLDESDNLVSFGFTLDGDELHRLIPAYQTAPDINGNPHFPSVYISIEYPSSVGIDPDLRRYQPAPIPGLLWKSDDGFFWRVVEKRDGKAVRWGYCGTLNKEVRSCVREFTNSGKIFSYDVPHQNAAHYQAIDGVLADKLASWRCEQ